MFFTIVNGHRSGDVVQWSQDRVGDIVSQGHQKIYKTAITAFDISRSGSYLGVGTSDGEDSKEPLLLFKDPEWEGILVADNNLVTFTFTERQALWTKA